MGKTEKFIDYNGQAVAVSSGYPVADWSLAISHILEMNAAAEATDTKQICSGFDFCGAGDLDSDHEIFSGLNLASNKVAVIWLEEFKLSDHCFVYYVNNNDGNLPRTGVVATGC